jgi:hypothetical protein
MVQIVHCMFHKQSQIFRIALLLLLAVPLSGKVSVGYEECRFNWNWEIIQQLFQGLLCDSLSVKLKEQSTNVTSTNLSKLLRLCFLQLFLCLFLLNGCLLSLLFTRSVVFDLVQIVQRLRRVLAEVSTRSPLVVVVGRVGRDPGQADYARLGKAAHRTGADENWNIGVFIIYVYMFCFLSRLDCIIKKRCKILHLIIFLIGQESLRPKTNVSCPNFF